MPTPQKINTININYPAGPNSALPTQSKFHQSKAMTRIMWGGYGSGKTLALSMEILLQAFRFPGTEGLLARLYLSELRSTTLRELEDLAPLGTILAHNKSERLITFNTPGIKKSKLHYLGVSDNGLDKIKSYNLGFIAVDELTELSKDAYLFLTGRLRRLNSSHQFFAASNPNGMDWAYKLFVGPEAPKKPVRNLQGELVPDVESFQAKSEDNFYLPPDYIPSLRRKYSKNWQDRFLDCSFSDWSGLVYEEFRPQHIIDPIEPHGDSKFIFSLDWGFRNPSAILYAQVDKMGTVSIYDEFYQTGMLIPALANELKQKRFFDRATLICDPAIKQRERDGKSIYDDMITQGVYFQLGDSRNEVERLLKVNHYFKEDKLHITRNCIHTIDEISRWKWRQRRPGTERNDPESPVDKDNHTCDALAYLINYIQVPKENNNPDMPPEVKVWWDKFVLGKRPGKLHPWDDKKITYMGR